jgi:MFS family permease
VRAVTRTVSLSQARVIVPLGIHQILTWGTSFYLLAVLAAPTARDTGWPLAWVTAGISLALVSSGIVSPLVGRCIERFGGGRVLASGSLLLAAGLAGLALAPSLPVYLAAWAVLGAGMGSALYDAAFSSLGKHFGAAARKPITTLTLFGGFASTVCWPLSAFLVESFGWREACGFYAALHVFVTAPLALLAFSRRSPASRKNGADARAGSAPPAQNKLLMPLLTVVFVIGSAIFSIVAVHLLNLLQGLGFTLAAAVALGALVGPSQVGARAIEMLFGVRLHPVWTVLFAVTLIFLGLALLYSGYVFASACLILYGAGNGIWSISRGTVPLALFGAADFPRIMAGLARAAFLAQAVAPFIGAIAISRFGEGVSLGALATLAAMNLLLVLALVGLAKRS